MASVSIPPATTVELPTTSSRSTLRQKTVLITGCSPSGIGSSLCTAFSHAGYHVYATARSSAKLSHLSSLPSVTLLTLDVTSPTSIATAVEKVERLDVLVNNAGAQHIMPLLDTADAASRALFDVNVHGPMNLTQAFAAKLIESKGTIVNVASIAAHLNSPWMGAYAASKAAAEAWSETLRVEVAPLGVRVLTVVTGVVESKLFVNMSQPFQGLPEGSFYGPAEERIGVRARGEDVARQMDAVVYAKKVVADVERGRVGKSWRGEIASVVWFFERLVPDWIVDWLILRGTGLDCLPKT